MSVKDTVARYDNYDIKVKEFSNGQVEYIKYSKPIYKKIKSDDDKTTTRIKKPKSEEGEIRYDSINRSYRQMMDLAIQNAKEFKTFITITFKENVSDLNVANKKFNNLMKSIRRHYPDFKYLGSPEFQKRGAVHYHLMTNLTLQDNKVIVKQEGQDNMYDIKQWDKGWTSVFDLSLTNNNFSIAAYMTKYYFKDIDNRLFGRKKVLYSQNLDKPTETTYRENTQELENYQKYLERYKEKTKEKHILSDKEYAPSMTIYTFNTSKV